MPILTFPLALALSTCFVVGSLVTWVLQERRRRIEREDLEREMTRALQTRYEVYEGLEQTVIKLLTKFDAMEVEFRQRLAQQSSHPRGAALDRTVRMRSANPELWDIEREHHRVTSEQLSEISRRSARITELMEQVQSLEPAKQKVESELAGLKHRYENAVANSTEFEQASGLKIERLQARVAELEPLGSLLEASRRELAAAQIERDQALEAGARQIAELNQRVDTLAQAEARVEELENLVSVRDNEAGEQSLRILELEGEWAGSKQLLAKSQTRCTELDGQCKAMREELQGARSQLESLRVSHDNVWKELEASKKELSEASQRCEVYSADLSKARKALDDAHHAAAGSQKLAEQNKARVTELEGQLADARGQHAAQQAKFDESISELRQRAQLAEAKAASIEEALDGVREAQIAEQAVASERIAQLSRELDIARTEMIVHRAKLAARSSHVVEAWSVLSELKPMLETLEQKLKESDEPPSALPSARNANQAAPSTPAKSEAHKD
jgi:DNA repair exonuclease SbcCD ATPase subunit